MKAVIMAGGKGTRIASITQDEIPKPMLTVGGKPILEHQIECLKKSGVDEVIIIVGHLGEVIENYFGDGTDFGIDIRYVREDPEKPLGTAGSLYFLKDDIKDDFLFIFGDVFLSVDFNKMIRFHKSHKAAVTLLTHPNSHPFDSDLIKVGKNGRVLKFDSKTNVRDYDYNNIVNSGISAFSPKVFDYIPEPKKLGIEHGVVAKMLEDGLGVYSYQSTEYVKDMGTPERYEAVNADFRNGICTARNLENKQKCIFLDRDGTINEYVPFLKDPNKIKLIPGVAEAIKKINSSEYLCIVVTNQPIIARGESTVENLENIHRRLETELGKAGAYIDGLYYCPHHPDKGYPGEVPELKIVCDCRKPAIGMVLQAAKDFNIDLSQSIMIGDTTSDIQMAKNAGMQSILVETGEGGKDRKYDVVPDAVCHNLVEAVATIVVKKNEKTKQISL